MHSPTPTARSDRKNWLAVISLAFGAFASVTTEFIPVGVLPDIADTFGITAGQAGLMMTLPGILGAISAPGILIGAGKIDRKILLLTLSALLLLSATVSAFSVSYPVMLVSRGVAGLSLGAFWGMGLAVAGNLMGTGKASAGLAAVFGGVSLAMILGVPLGTVVAEYFSWRGSFLAAGAISAAALVMQAILLPRIPAQEALRVSALLHFLRRPMGRKSLLFVALIYGTHFGTYTYLAPLMRGAHVSTTAISWVLLGFGVTGFIANFYALRFTGMHLRLTLTAGLLLFAGSLLALPLLTQQWLIVTCVLIWGAAWGAIPLCLNIINRHASGNEIEAGSALITFMAQVAIAGGSAGGGIIVDHISIGGDFIAGSGIVLLTLLFFWFRTSTSDIPREAAQPSHQESA